MSAPTPATAATAAPANSTQGSRGSRLAALTGIVFVVMLVASFIAGTSSPGTDETAAKISHYYLTHQHRTGADGLLTVLAVTSGLAFFTYLRSYFRRLTATDWLPGLFFTGGLVFGISGAISAGVSFTLADHQDLQSASSLQLLNTLSQNLSWAALCVGLTLLYAALGIIIIRTRVVPVWLAWLSWLMSLLAASFFLSFIPFLAAPLWALVVSIRMAQRNPAVS